MIRDAALIGAWMLVGLLGVARADVTTVQSLLTQGYTVVGTVLSANKGAGVFLVKGDSLMFCDIAETPTSTTVATRYCTPVK